VTAQGVPSSLGRFYDLLSIYKNNRNALWPITIAGTCPPY